jgi:hypothetical protein
LNSPNKMNTLNKIRLTHYFIFFLIFFALVSVLVEGQKFEGVALTLFSINSFLYGFYINPILTAQKARIDDIQRANRAEAIALFSVMIKTKDLPKTIRNQAQEMVKNYLSKIKNYTEAEENYESIITWTVKQHAADPESKPIQSMLDGIASNQTNRSNRQMAIGAKVYTNEWWVIFMLFAITLGFVIMFQTSGLIILIPVKAFLCTALSMLIINLLKLNSLAHKRAKDVWRPLETLQTTDFYRID